jgi:hypothetical protein
MKIEVPENGKFYTTEDDTNVYFTTFWFSVLLLVALYTLVKLIQNNNYGWFTLVCALAVIFFTYIIWRAFVIGASAFLTEHTVIGYNAFDKRIGEMAFEDIKEMYTMFGKQSYDVVLKSVNGKKIIINAAVQPADEFFNTILKQAVNCKRISIETAKDFAPNLIMYKKEMK